MVKHLRLVSVSVPSSQKPGGLSSQHRGFARRGEAAPQPEGGRGRGRHAARSVSVAPAFVPDAGPAETGLGPLPDPIAWRGGFARVWQAFLLGRWGADPHAIADAFGVRVQTARNWLDGLHIPTGDVAARAMLTWRAEILAAAVRVGLR